jgi:hypothetical protein
MFAEAETSPKKISHSGIIGLTPSPCGLRLNQRSIVTPQKPSLAPDQSSCLTGWDLLYPLKAHSSSGMSLPVLALRAPSSPVSQRLQYPVATGLTRAGRGLSTETAALVWVGSGGPLVGGSFSLETSRHAQVSETYATVT